MAHQLAVVGPLPPPIGGVAVHVERLLPYLDNVTLDYIVYNTAGTTEIDGRAVSVARRKHWWFLRYLLFGQESVAYFLGNQWQIWAASWFLTRVRGKKVVINMQGEALRWAWESHGRFIRRLIANGLDAAAGLIPCNEHIRDYLRKIGDFDHKTIVVPGFIPPTQRDEDQAAVPDHIKRFCAEHDPVLLATGASVLRENNTDLYGIDMTIELVDRLRASYPNIGLLWFLLEIIGDVPEYSEKMRHEVDRRELHAHWLFCEPLAPFYPMYGLADIMVRPTLSDGDALSVREALYFGLPTVASDAVPRPKEVILCRKRDQEDYERVVRQTLDNLDAERERLRHRPGGTAVDQEVALLKEVVAAANA